MSAKSLTVPQIIFVSVVALVFLCIAFGKACAPSSTGKAISKDPVSAPVTTQVTAQASKTYDEPEIGMTYESFKALCGKPDDVREMAFASGKTYILEFEHRSTTQHGCWGTYYFDGSKLTHYYRN